MSVQLANSLYHNPTVSRREAIGTLGKAGVSSVARANLGTIGTFLAKRFIKNANKPKPEEPKPSKQTPVTVGDRRQFLGLRHVDQIRTVASAINSARDTKTIDTTAVQSLPAKREVKPTGPSISRRSFFGLRETPEVNMDSTKITVEDAIELVKNGEDEEMVADTLLETMVSGLFPSQTPNSEEADDEQN